MQLTDEELRREAECLRADLARAKPFGPNQRAAIAMLVRVTPRNPDELGMPSPAPRSGVNVNDHQPFNDCPLAA